MAREVMCVGSQLISARQRHVYAQIVTRLLDSAYLRGFRTKTKVRTEKIEGGVNSECSQLGRLVIVVKLKGTWFTTWLRRIKIKEHFANQELRWFGKIGPGKIMEYNAAGKREVVLRYSLTIPGGNMPAIPINNIAVHKYFTMAVHSLGYEEVAQKEIMAANPAPILTQA
jgi:hypothetical protein